ncbi:hypothetical protein HDU83_005743 [Entophlyctis luteolus]|nr:hypothetical protein HDU82_003656 [Entophlyctis luteolus]KAJ3354137.1 hypothetical protein HDU83_005743 [Entophlyctis luteolus]KAJ3392655.1 hypothetical protein HDU84_003661 [Entophlyctis sp. JEL0112]
MSLPFLPVEGFPWIQLTTPLAQDLDSLDEVHDHQTPREKLERYFQRMVSTCNESWRACTRNEVPNSWPYFAIRLVAPEGDGPGRLIGELGAGDWRFDYVQPEELRLRLTEENSARHAGDPEKVVMIGYTLHKDFRRQGIATACVNAMVSWMHSRMHVKRIVAACALENAASAGLLAKCGFQRGKEYETSMGRHDFGWMIHWDHFEESDGLH